MASFRHGGKSAAAFRTISEVAEDIDVPQHVLRFWETKFTQLKPMKRGGGRRYYRPEDVESLRQIKHLLYDEGYTIKGVQKLLRSGMLKGSEPSVQEDGVVASSFSVPRNVGEGSVDSLKSKTDLQEKVSARQVGKQSLGEEKIREKLQEIIQELESLQEIIKSMK